MFCEVSRHARRVRLTERQRAGTGFYQQAVGVAMVTAFELDNLVTAGKAARQTDGAHGRFRTGVHHTYHVHCRHQLGDQLRHFDFHLGWRTEAQAALSGFNHRVADRRVVVAQYHRAPGADVIDIGFTIHIIQICAIRTFDKQRGATHAGKGAHR